MLHAPYPVYDLHDGAADVHPQGALLRASHRHLSDVPLRDALRSATGSVLHDALRAASRLPPGSGAGLLPGSLQPAGSGPLLQLKSPATS